MTVSSDGPFLGAKLPMLLVCSVGLGIPHTRC